jgi:SAM-dependent methyltransferase
LFEYVANPLDVVRTMARAVRPSGRIVLADDDYDLPLMQVWGRSNQPPACYRSRHLSRTVPQRHDERTQHVRPSVRFNQALDHSGLVDPTGGIVGQRRV